MSSTSTSRVSTRSRPESLLLRFIGDQPHQGREPLDPTHVDQRRQQRDQQRRVGRVEDEGAAEQLHVGASTARAVADLGRRRRRHLGVDALWLHRLEARQDEARRRRQEDEVVGLERDHRLAVDRETAAALEHGTEAGMAKLRVANPPATGTADPLREHGARLQQRDDLRERVVHARTLANEVRPSHRDSPKRRRPTARQRASRVTNSLSSIWVASPKCSWFEIWTCEPTTCR